MSVTKYRMWDGRKMHSNNEIKHYELGVLQGTSYEVMTFTGLLDKLGVEIYEGDIIKWYAGQMKHIPVHSEVKWDNIESRFSFGCKADAQYMLYKTEVTGNIYENHELLGVEK